MGFCGNTCFGSSSYADMGRNRMAAQGQADHVRCCYGRYSRISNSDTRFRFYKSVIGPDYRTGCWICMLYCSQP